MSSWFLCHLINWAPSCYTVLWQYHFLHFILLLDCLQAKCASLLFLQMESHCVMFSSYLKWHLMEAVISCSQHFSRLPPCIRVSFPKPRRNSFQVYIFFLSFLYVGGKMVPCFIKWPDFFLNACSKSGPIMEAGGSCHLLTSLFDQVHSFITIHKMTDLYFVREEKLALDNAGHLVRFHSQICQPFNDSQSTKQYFACT